MRIRGRYVGRGVTSLFPVLHGWYAFIDTCIVGRITSSSGESGSLHATTVVAAVLRSSRTDRWRNINSHSLDVIILILDQRAV